MHKGLKHVELGKRTQTVYSLYSFTEINMYTVCILLPKSTCIQSVFFYRNQHVYSLYSFTEINMYTVCILLPKSTCIQSVFFYRNQHVYSLYSFTEINMLQVYSFTEVNMIQTSMVYVTESNTYFLVLSLASQKEW